MKKLHFFFLLFFAATALQAQQQAIFSQFFYAQRAMNPAAAGSSHRPSLAAFHRQQWAGLEGSPSTQALAFDAPAFGERVGLGLTLMSDRIGFFHSTYVNASYAYRVKFRKGSLGVGMNGSYQRHRTDWSAARTLSGYADPTEDMGTKTPAFNVGLGLHFEMERGFVGLAVQGLLQRGLTPEKEGIVTDFSGTTPHVFWTAGWVAAVSQSVKIRPAIATRWAKNAPSSTDIHLSFGFLEDARLWVGGTYRWSFSKVTSRGDALSASVQYEIGERLRAGLAYDFSLHSLQTQYAQTYELMLEYGLTGERTGVRHPRFF